MNMPRCRLCGCALPWHYQGCQWRKLPYALSAKSLSQAEMPLGLALRLYEAFSAAVQRKWTCCVALSLAGRGGLPLLGGVMASIMVYTNNSCNPPE